MNKISARVFYCTFPAVIGGLVFSVLHPLAGLIVFGCVFGIGLQVTGASNDR